MPESEVDVIVSLLEKPEVEELDLQEDSVFSHAATVLALRGVSIETAFAMIAKARGFSVPDTDQQRVWIINLIKSVSGLPWPIARRVRE